MNKNETKREFSTMSSTICTALAAFAVSISAAIAAPATNAATVAPSIATGQTMEQVKAALGKPSGTMTTKGKAVWVYERGDVVFDTNSTVESATWLDDAELKTKHDNERSREIAAKIRDGDQRMKNLHEAMNQPAPTAAASPRSTPRTLQTSNEAKSISLSAWALRKETFGDYRRAAQGKTLLIVTATIMNTGAAAVDANEYGFSARDNNGKVYGRDAYSNFAYTKISAGEKVEGVLLFEIPAGAGAMTLIFNGGGATGECPIK